MQVLLWHTIENLGKRGDVVEVKDGYARNFLIPRRMASTPTPGQYREFEVEKRRQNQVEVQLIEGAKEVEAKLAEVTSLSIEVNTNEEGVLYGSVSPTMISEALLAENMKVEARAITIDEPIKKIGTYEVTVHLHRDVQPKIKVWVLSTKAIKLEDVADREEDAPVDEVDETEETTSEE